MRDRLLVAAALLVPFAGAIVLLPQHPTEPPKPTCANAYADPATCVRCHAAEAAGYARTGMAHSFHQPAAANTVAAPAPSTQFYHAASDTFFSITQHNGSFFERRWQKGFDGNPDNLSELRIDFVMGSGNHVRTYLHREPDGTLIELPLAWYAENGGHFGMNPGYANPHPPTGRIIAYECLFCHDDFPRIPATAHRDLAANPVYTSLPQGIGCQRCHGPGLRHVQLAQQPGASPDAIRAAILNPVKLSNARQMQVCEQCHLETISRPLPDRIHHYDREPFGYDPNTPLSRFNAYFTRDPKSGRTDTFEIASAPYRLRQSQCYLKSAGALTCETCHDPHDLHKGPASAAYYANICMSCHAPRLNREIALHQHPAGDGCIACHMPRRRTEDVVDAVMTDHLIQRRPPPAAQLLAARTEIDDAAPPYRGEVKRYLLDGELPSSDDALYDALAQVIDGSNLQVGVPQLRQQLQHHSPQQPNAWIELGDAQRKLEDLTGAIASYRKALQLDPLSERGQRRLGAALSMAGQTTEAVAVLRTAAARATSNPFLWYELATVESKTGDLQQAIPDLRRTIALRPSFADAQDSLGSALAQSGHLPAAATAFRSALAADPYDASTRANLGRLLASTGDWPEALFQLDRAIHLNPADVSLRDDDAIAHLQTHDISGALREARAAIAADPRSARAHDVFGQLLIQAGKASSASAEFQTALTLDPNLPQAQLDLAEALILTNNIQPALDLLRKAAASSNPAIAQQARSLLTQAVSH